MRILFLGDVVGRSGSASALIAGTSLGQDKATQITTIITGQVVSLRREVGSSIRLDLDGSSAYTLILLQNGVENVVKVNGGSANTITIKQGS